MHKNPLHTPALTLLDGFSCTWLRITLYLLYKLGTLDTSFLQKTVEITVMKNSYLKITEVI